MPAEKNTANRDDDAWSKELELLQSIIAKTNLTQTIKWGGITYTLNNKNVIGIGSFKNYFAIWFYNGVFLKDEKKVLVNAQEGITKALRQWRFYSKSEIDEKIILDYIQEAIKNTTEGKRIIPEKKEVVISHLFQKELLNNTALSAAFEKLSISKQNEFLEYIETAKREETKVARIEKIKPLILQHIGMNDKYK